MKPQRSETRLATLLIGIIQIAWSIMPVTGLDWKFNRVLRVYDQTNEWLWFMMLFGWALIFGALFPLRKLRQIALFMSSTVWFTSFAIWVNYAVWTERWSPSAATILFPVFGVFSLWLLANDICQKPGRNR